METIFDSRQTEYKDPLERISFDIPSNLKDLIKSTDRELVVPYQMNASSAPDLTVNIASNTVTNTTNNRVRQSLPLNNNIPVFNSGSIVFPSTPGGTITVTPGDDITLTMGNDAYMRVGVSIDESGSIYLAFGTEGVTELAAGYPALNSRNTNCGYILLQTVAGTVQNITQNTIVEYSGQGASNGLQTDLLNNTNNGETAIISKHYLVDTSAASFTINLPSGEDRATIRFSDANETWGTNSIFIAPASGESIDGYAIDEVLELDVSQVWVQFMWDGSKWVIDTPLAGSTVDVASETQPGIVSTIAQSFAGDKIFTDNILVQGTISGELNDYILSFVIGDWVEDIPNDEWTLTILASNHNKGTRPTVTVTENDGPTNNLLVHCVKSINNLGDIILAVSRSPDFRFDGKVSII